MQRPESPGAEVLRHAGRIALKNDVRTAIENEVHRVLKEAADAVIVAGFAESARRRLLAAPFGARPVLGVDPDPRTAAGWRRSTRRAASSRAASSSSRATSRSAAAGELAGRASPASTAPARSRSATAPAAATWSF